MPARISASRDGGGPGPAALGIGQAARVADQDRHHPRGQGRAQRRAEGDAAKQAQHLVGIDGRRVEHAAEDQRPAAQSEDRAVDGRLERDVGVAEQRQVAETEDHGQPVAGDERVDEGDRQHRREGERRGAAHLAPDAGRVTGGHDGQHHGPEDDRVGDDQRGDAERQAVGATDGGAGAVQRAGAPAVDHCEA